MKRSRNNLKEENINLNINLEIKDVYIKYIFLICFNKNLYIFNLQN